MKKALKIVIPVVCVIAALCTCFAILCNKRIIRFGWPKKEECVQTFVTPQKQTVITVGTFHGNHFDKSKDYSLCDIQSLIQYSQCDYVFIESRPETFENYGAIDGPIEMLFIYTYCQKHLIPVKMIDWWQENNQSKANTTSEERDDHIFNNIKANLEKIPAGKTIIVFYGTAHYRAQMPRMINQGWQYAVYGNPNEYFKESKDTIKYPEALPQEIDKKIEFCNTWERDSINKNITDKKVHDEFMANLDNLIENLKKQKQVVLANELYYSNDK